MHATQETSREAYEHIKPDVGHRQLQVFDVIRTSPNNITDKEIAVKLGWDINRVTPRRGELVDMGLVFEDETRNCKVTGFRARAWVTSKGTLF